MPELSKLKGRIREKGSNYRDISKEIGMSLSAFNDKMNGRTAFDIVEASKVAAILDISPENIAYFFT